MSISVGFTAEEIREFVHQYELQPYGQKGAWLASRRVSHDRLRRWQSAVFDGDLDRGLVPREGSPMTVPRGKRTAFEKQRAAERAARDAEVERLSARVRELEETNEVLGKAIGLLHSMNEQEPDATQVMTDQSGSLPPRTNSSSS